MSENDTVSSWFSLTAGFKVHVRCPECFSPNVAFHSTRTTGLKGITTSSKGLAAACIDCGKNLPSQMPGKKKALKTRVMKHQCA